MDRIEQPTEQAKRSTAWWVTLTYSVAAAVVVGIAVATHRETNHLIATQNAVGHTHVVLGTLERAFSGLVGAASAVRDYVVTDDEAALAGRDEELSRLHTAVQNLNDLTADNPDQQRRVDELRPLVAARVEWLNRTLLAHQADIGPSAAELLRHPEPRRLMAEIRALLDEMRLVEERLLSMRLSAGEASRARTTVVGALLLVAVGVAVLAGLVALLRDGRYKDRLRVLVLERGRRLAATNAELKRRSEALAAANKELEGFSYSVSHDLRAPLRAIDGFAAMLEEDCADQLGTDGRRYIGVVRDNAARMGALIDDLLRFSRLGRQRLAVSEFPTEAVVRRARDEALAAYPQAVTQFEIEPLPPTHGDPSLLHQVWVNLIANAVKYSARVPTPRVVIGGAADEREATFFVRDNGAGFDMKFAGKLFGVFQRLHGADEFPGTGVGLAIVHRIVTRHGGRVWAESELSNGATFYFALPFAKPDGAQEVFTA